MSDVNLISQHYYKILKKLKEVDKNYKKITYDNPDNVCSTIINKFNIRGKAIVVWAEFKGLEAISIEVMSDLPVGPFIGQIEEKLDEIIKGE